MALTREDRIALRAQLLEYYLDHGLPATPSTSDLFALAAKFNCSVADIEPLLIDFARRGSPALRPGAPSAASSQQNSPTSVRPSSRSIFDVLERTRNGERDITPTPKGKKHGRVEEESDEDSEEDILPRRKRNRSSRNDNVAPRDPPVTLEEFRQRLEELEQELNALNSELDDTDKKIQKLKMENERLEHEVAESEKDAVDEATRQYKETKFWQGRCQDFESATKRLTQELSTVRNLAREQHRENNLLRERVANCEGCRHQKHMNRTLHEEIDRMQEKQTRRRGGALRHPDPNAPQPKPRDPMSKKEAANVKTDADTICGTAPLGRREAAILASKRLEQYKSKPKASKPCGQCQNVVCICCTDCHHHPCDCDSYYE